MRKHGWALLVQDVPPRHGDFCCLSLSCTDLVSAWFWGREVSIPRPAVARASDLNKIPHGFRYHVLSYNLTSGSHSVFMGWEWVRSGTISVDPYQLHILNRKSTDLQIHTVWSMLEDLRLHMFGPGVLCLWYPGARGGSDLAYVKHVLSTQQILLVSCLLQK